MSDSEMTDGFPEFVGIPEPVEETIMEAPPKRRNRQRLLDSLQRISSSPSLVRRARARSSSGPYGGTASFSYVSLASGPPPPGPPSSNSYFSPWSPGYSTAPTSVAGTPLVESPGDGIESRMAIKRIHTLEGSAMAVPPITISLPARVRPRMSVFNMWKNMPREIKVHIFSFLQPKELVRASRVSKEFYKMCFDGQLWTCFDASEFYKDIPAESLAKIIVAAGPFVKDLNLRGCLQVEHYKWAEVVAKACKNLINATLEGCRNFQKSTLHSLLRSNEKLANLNLTGLTAVTNTTCRIIAQSCPQLEMFNVSWCTHMDARGIKAVVEGCPRLKDLRAGEVRGFESREVAEALFRTNNLERLVLAGCDEINDNVLRAIFHGVDPDIDILTNLPVVPPRRLRHLDLSRCTGLTTHGVVALGHLVPELEGLRLSGCSALTDAALEPILATAPRLTHLELEDLTELTNAILSEHLAKSPCAPNLELLSISYCENLGDAGMLPVIRACTRLRRVDMDNTRVSDLVLAEAAAMVRARAGRTSSAALGSRPCVGLSMVVYDCQNVTWTGVREVLSRNAEVKTPPPPPPPPRSPSSSGDVQAPARAAPTFPTEIIALKCFYGWQMTVDEHTKRVLRGDLAAASKLERKWADYMQASEEAGLAGAGSRRRRRRAREAQMLHADEEDGAAGGAGGGRRRARTAACVVM